MPGIGHLLSWIILGGIVGWVVSLIMGEKFKGGPLTYIIVGIVTLVVLGIALSVLKQLAWLVFVIAVVIVAIAAVVRLVAGA